MTLGLDRVQDSPMDKMNLDKMNPSLRASGAVPTAIKTYTSADAIACLRAAGVPCEAHLFQEGGHGFGIRLIQGKPAQVWPDLVRAWAVRLDFPL